MPYKSSTPLVIMSVAALMIIVGAALFYCRAMDGVPNAWANTGETRQEPGAGVATVQTPEQTHAKFMESLINNDIYSAVECYVAENRRQIIKEIIFGTEQKGLYDVMLKELGTITSSTVSASRATYIYSGTVSEEGVELGRMIFSKNNKGIWLIESF
jgi:hypothetical protein